MFDIFIYSSSKENVITRRQNRNAISLKLSATRRNRVADHSELGEQIECVIEDMFNISFLYQRIIKFN